MRVRRVEGRSTDPKIASGIYPGGNNMRTRCAIAGAVVTGILTLLPVAKAAALDQFGQTNLVSDGAVPAATIDPQLVNPWGISFSPTSPFWISDNGTGVTTLYNGA